jgi:hypothetical protein
VAGGLVGAVRAGIAVTGPVDRFVVALFPYIAGSAFITYQVDIDGNVSERSFLCDHVLPWETDGSMPGLSCAGAQCFLAASAVESGNINISGLFAFLR